MNETAQAQTGFYTEDMTISVGPQHPSTMRLCALSSTDGEGIASDSDVGYLHRSIENRRGRLLYHGYVPYTDRADYLARCCNQAFCMAAEKLAGTEVTRRGEFCRVIACELNRIASHLISVGTFGQDIGAMTPFVHALRERETINNLMEEICGARLTYNYIRIGGVGYDIFPETCGRIGEFLDHFEPIVGEFNRLLSGNKIFIERLAGVAVVTKKTLFPNLVGQTCAVRASLGHPPRYSHSVYPELDFDMPVARQKSALWATFDRYWCDS
jgi:NADH-quinone oxidoreductase subunit D